MKLSLVPPTIIFNLITFGLANALDQSSISICLTVLCLSKAASISGCQLSTIYTDETISLVRGTTASTEACRTGIFVISYLKYGHE